jgi:uncharacterized protein YbcI
MPRSTQPEAEPSATDSSISRSAIANAIVRLHVEHFGRGPTRARAHIADDVILVVLEDVFTTAERTLVAGGRGDQVQAGRSAFAEVMRERFCATVQSICGRRVRVYLNQTHLDPEVAIELFVLEPEVT